MNEQQLDQDTMEDQALLNTDLENLNVNVWFNRLESRLQYCLVKENAREGFMQYKMLVKHAEILAISANKLNEKEYLKEVEETKKEEIDDTDTEEVKQMREAMIKYKIILKNILKVNKSNLNLTYKQFPQKL